MSYKIIDCEQGGDIWLALRRTKITATDSGVLLGLNPWKTPLMLYEEKLGLREQQAVNDKMKEGTLLEEKAREYFNKTYDSDFKPVVLESCIHPFMMASLDGMNSKGEILEIKCGKKSYESAYNNIIEPYYFSQIQKQMYVADADKVIYLCYRSDTDMIQRKYYRNDDYIENMIESEKQFYQCLQNFTPPPATDHDFVKKNDDLWDFHTKEYLLAKQEKEKYQKTEDIHRNILISLCDGQSSQGNGIRVSKTMSKGRVDYSKIEELKNIDLDLYRGKSIVSYRFTEMKGEDE